MDFVPMAADTRLQLPMPAASVTVQVAPAPSATATVPDGVPPVEVTETETA